MEEKTSYYALGKPPDSWKTCTLDQNLAEKEHGRNKQQALKDLHFEQFHSYSSMNIQTINKNFGCLKKLTCQRNLLRSIDNNLPQQKDIKGRLVSPNKTKLKRFYHLMSLQNLSLTIPSIGNNTATPLFPVCQNKFLPKKKEGHSSPRFGLIENQKIFK